MLEYTLLSCSSDNVLTERVTIPKLSESDGHRLKAAAEVVMAKFAHERQK